MLAPAAPDTFVPLDLGAPLDVKDAVADLPVTEGVRGFMLAPLCERARSLGRGAGLPTEFNSTRVYPLAMANCWRIDVARALYPGEPLRAALVKIGALSHDALIASPNGRVVFAQHPRSPKGFASLIVPGMNMVSHGPRASLLELSEHRCVVARITTARCSSRSSARLAVVSSFVARQRRS